MNDFISRQAAIDTLVIDEELLKRVLDNVDIVGNEREKYEWGLGLIEAHIADMKDLPSIQPEWKKGKWIYKKDLKQFFCDQCGEPSLTDDDRYIYSMDFSNFCPNCGADMRGEKDD